jgi:hypothetical protein
MLDFDRWLSFALCAGVLLGACMSHDNQNAPQRADAGRRLDAGSAAGGDDDAGGSAGARRFVGDVADSDSRVAVISGAGKLRLFFCGGPDTVAQATHWFNVEVTGSDVAIEMAPWKVSARIEADGVSGQVTREDGVLRHFSAAPVATGTLSGLYEGTANCGRLGLVVAQPSPGAPIEAQGACVGEGHVPEQVNPILPIAEDMGEIAVKVPGDEASTSLLQPASLQPL